MAVSVGDLIAYLSLRTQDWTSGLNVAEKGLAKFGNVVDEKLSELGFGGLRLGTIISSLGNPLVAAGAAVATLGGAAGLAAHHMMDLHEEGKRLAAIMGTNEVAALNLRQAWYKADGDAGMLDMAMSRLSAEIDDGGKKLDRYGISIRDINGGVREVGDVFQELAGKLSKVDPVARVAALRDFFGRGGAAMAKTIQELSEEMDKLAKSGANVMTEEQIRVAQQYEDRFKDLKFAVSQLVVAYGDLASAAVNAMASVGRSLSAWAEQKRLIGQLTAKDGGILGALESSFLGVFGGTFLQKLFTGTGPEIEVSTARALTENVPKGVKKAGDALAGTLRPFEIQWRLAGNTETMSQAKREIQAVTAMVDAEVSRGAFSEGMATSIKLGLLAKERAATEDFYRKKISDLRNAADVDKVLIQQTLTAEKDALAQIDAKTTASLAAREGAYHALNDAVASIIQRRSPATDFSAVNQGVATTTQNLVEARAAVDDFYAAWSKAYGSSAVVFGDKLNISAAQYNAYLAQRQGLTNNLLAAENAYYQSLEAVNAAQERERNRPRLAEGLSALEQFKQDANKAAQNIASLEAAGVPQDQVWEEQNRYGKMFAETWRGLNEQFKGTPFVLDQLNQKFAALRDGEFIQWVQSVKLNYEQMKTSTAGVQQATHNLAETMRSETTQAAAVAWQSYEEVRVVLAEVAAQSDYTRERLRLMHQEMTS